MDEPACQLLGVLIGRCRLSLGKLHFQAHQSAKARDEFTLPGGMVAPDKHEMLCHDLLLIEAWREHVFSRFARKNESRGSSKWGLSYLRW